MKMGKTEYSETSAYKFQTQENYPEENLHHVYCLSAEITDNFDYFLVT